MVSDSLLLVDETPHNSGLFHVCGFSSYGFQLFPMIAVPALSLILGYRSELSLAPFSIDRFTYKWNKKTQRSSSV